jgi:hypothetical protein
VRHAIVTMLAAFVGVLLALFVFHQYRKYDAERERAAADTVLQAKVEQGRKLAERTLAQAHEAQVIREALVVASSAKAAVAEYYLTTGEMPGDNAQLGLGAADTWRGTSLRSLQIAEGGRILLAFDETSGVNDGVIELTPDLADNESMGVQWQCATHDFPHIARVWPGSGCAYVARNPGEPAVSE